MLVRTLYLILMIEVLAGVYLLGGRAMRPRVQLPPVDQMHPVLAADLTELAVQTEADGSPEAWMELSEALVAQGFYCYAEQGFRYVLRGQPENTLARARLAYCLERSGRTTESTEQYRVITSADATSRNAVEQRMHFLYEIGRNLLREEKADEAEAVFRQNRGFQPARYQLAKLMMRKGRSEAALRIIDESLEQLPNSLKFHELKCRDLRALGRTEEANETAFRKEQSTHRVPLNSSGESLVSYRSRYGLDQRMEEFNAVIDQGNLDRMADKLAELRALVKDAQSTHRPLILERILEIERQRQNPEQMLAVVETMHQAGNFSWNVLQYEAEARLLQGDLAAAISLERRAAMMSSEPLVHNRLADMLLQAGDQAGHDRARAMALRLQAELEFRAGEDEQLRNARDSIEKSLELNSGDPLTWFYRGEIRRASEGFAVAVSDYQECLLRDPNCGRAIRRLVEAKARKTAAARS